MRKVFSVILALTMMVAVFGCTAKKQPVAEHSLSPEYEIVDWNVVSINPSDYGITYEMLTFIEPPNFSEFTLAKLCAYHLYTDGAGAEGSGDTLYKRFMDAPTKVLNYFALIGDQVARGGQSGNETAVRELCREIASADVFWYGNTQEFSSIIKQYQEIYPRGNISEILTSLQEEHDAAIDRSP